MHPEAALNAQIDRYREMTTEQRVLIALRLHELAAAMLRVILRQQSPEVSETQLIRLAHQRLGCALCER